MEPINFLDAIAEQLNCEPLALHDYLNHPIAQKKISEYLKDKKLRTTYLNLDLEKKNVKFDGLSLKSACQQHAYEGFLGVTIQQHFYCRHRIRLMYPRLRCILERGKGGHNKYYPIELLEVVGDDQHTVSPTEKIQEEVRENVKEESTEKYKNKNWFEYKLCENNGNSSFPSRYKF